MTLVFQNQFIDNHVHLVTHPIMDGLVLVLVHVHVEVVEVQSLVFQKVLFLENMEEEPLQVLPMQLSVRFCARKKGKVMQNLLEVYSGMEELQGEEYQEILRQNKHLVHW